MIKEEVILIKKVVIFLSSVHLDSTDFFKFFKFELQTVLIRILLKCQRFSISGKMSTSCLLAVFVFLFRLATKPICLITCLGLSHI